MESVRWRPLARRSLDRIPVRPCSLEEADPPLLSAGLGGGRCGWSRPGHGRRTTWFLLPASRSVASSSDLLPPRPHRVVWLCWLGEEAKRGGGVGGGGDRRPRGRRCSGGGGGMERWLAAGVRSSRMARTRTTWLDPRDYCTSVDPGAGNLKLRWWLLANSILPFPVKITEYCFN